MSKKPTQAAIAAALQVSPGRVSQLVKDGMPTYSLEAAAAWKAQHVAPIMTRAKSKAAFAWPGAGLAQEGGAGVGSAEPTAAQTGRLVEDANQILRIAGAALDAGQNIEALMPTLRIAMAAVPRASRDLVELPMGVMDLLVAHIDVLLPPRSDNPLNEDGSPVYCDGADMTEDEAQSAGEFWYQVAAGEWVVAAVEPQDAAAV